MTIPNYFTLIRLVIAPLFLVFYTGYEQLGITAKELPYLLLALLTLSEVTDGFDGYLARRLNQVSDLGKILDPMADSLCRLTMFLAFTAQPINMPLYIFFIFFFRDSLISGLRTICAIKNYTLAARPSGKIKAILQAITAYLIILMMIPYAYGYLSQESLTFYSSLIGMITAIYSVLSGLEYFYANRKYISLMIPCENKG